MERFIIERNRYLERNITGYYHQLYTGYGQPDNPNFLNTLKNTFDTEPHNNLKIARNKVTEILIEDIPNIIRVERLSNCMCVCVPRAKVMEEYSDWQLMLREAIKNAANNIQGVIDGTDCITRRVNTRTTHLRNATNIPNDGQEPYKGITVDTCDIDKIKDQNVILIDDIYTFNAISEYFISSSLYTLLNKILFFLHHFQVMLGYNLHLY